VTAVVRSIPKQAFADSFQKLYERWNGVLWGMAIILKANKVNLFVSSVLFVFWYHSPNFLDTPHITVLFRYIVLHDLHPTHYVSTCLGTEICETETYAIFGLLANSCVCDPSDNSCVRYLRTEQVEP
jgi:hypothetical protein